MALKSANEDDLKAAPLLRAFQKRTQKMKITATPISRWESAIYKPSVSDLEELAWFFGVPVSVFFPDFQPSSQVHAELSATRGG